jgi:type IV pilus assembly protein PilM
MPATGVDITDNSVRFLALEKTSKGKRIKNKGSEKIEQGIISHGKIVDKDKLTSILAGVKAESGISYIHASLPEEQAYLFQTTIPDTSVDKQQLQTILEFKLEENVPVSSRDLVFDYEVVKGAAKNEIILNITAFPYEIASGYVEVFNRVGLIPLSLEIEAQSLARAVIPRHHSGTYMIIDFGRMRTGIAIVSEEVLRFTSTVAVGGDSLTKAVQKNFDVSKEEADKIKNEKGFARYKDNTEVLETLVATVSVLRDEVGKHYSYWNTRGGENERGREKIDKIILCGGSANLAGLSEYLASDLNITVEVANVWANTFSLNDFVPDIEYRHSLAYATSIGLALKGMD